MYADLQSPTISLPPIQLPQGSALRDIMPVHPAPRPFTEDIPAEKVEVSLRARYQPDAEDDVKETRTTHMGIVSNVTPMVIPPIVKNTSLVP